MRLLWQQTAQEEDWGFLLIDTHNGLYGENCTAMLWVVCHECPRGARFEFNCYHHWTTLVIRAGDGTDHLLHRKEGVTQVDTLDMIAYVLGTPPPLSRTSIRPTPESLSTGMLMTLGQEAPSQACNDILTTLWCEVPCGDNSQS